MNTEQTVGQSIYARSTLPEFKCHKRVKAARIMEIVGHATLSVDLHLENELDPIGVGPEWVNKHQPQVGQYFVMYADGYQSVSPAKAFEEGYLQVEPMLPQGVTEATAQEQPLVAAHPDCEARRLPAGTKVAIEGLPVALTHPAVLETHPENWELIDFVVSKNQPPTLGGAPTTTEDNTHE